MTSLPPIELEFSRKYDRAHAQQYYRKHSEGFWRRLSHWREITLARKALKAVGEPSLVLDLPCGAGRFWPMLAENPNRVIYAADNSKAMLETARLMQPPEVAARVNYFKTSAFDIDLDDNAVDSILCMRLLHHIADSGNRLALLQELHRVTRETVILSLWVDGNYKAWRRRRLEGKRSESQNVNRFVVPRVVIEREFAEAGFEIAEHRDFLPGYAMWCFYTLRKKNQLDTQATSANNPGSFDEWWGLRGETVEDPNLRRGGSSGVQCLAEPPGKQRLLYVKRQTGHLFRNFRYPFGRPTVLREKCAYRAYRQLGIQVPELVYFGVDKCQGHWRGLLVTAELEGFVSLADWYRVDARAYWGEDIHRQMLHKLAHTLSRLHSARWRHGCLYPKHIFVHVNALLKGGVNIALLDLEKSRRLWRISRASGDDMAQLKRHRGDMPDQDWAFLQRQYKHCLTLRKLI